jgi:hypothetical protein
MCAAARVHTLGNWQRSPHQLGLHVHTGANEFAADAGNTADATDVAAVIVPP